MKNRKKEIVNCRVVPWLVLKFSLLYLVLVWWIIFIIEQRREREEAKEIWYESASENFNKIIYTDWYQNNIYNITFMA